MRQIVRNRRWTPVVLTCLVTAVAPVGAHEPGAAVSDHGLGFGIVVALTVTLGVLGGAVVVRRHRSRADHPSMRWMGLLLVILGGWAAVVAVLQGAAFAAVVVAAGAVATWSLRNRAVVGHRGGDQAALGAVVLHRFVEGTLLAALYSTEVAVGIGAALVLATHAAAETGAVTGLWSAGRWRWVIVTLVQVSFVAGALGGSLVIQLATPRTSFTVLALVGGVLIAAGVATVSNVQHPIPA